MNDNIFDPVTRKPRMCREMCSTCILRPGSAVTASLKPGRLLDLINSARQNETYVICHSTLDGEPAICRGFAEHFSTNILRIYDRLGGFHEVDSPCLTEKFAS